MSKRFDVTRGDHIFRAAREAAWATLVVAGLGFPIIAYRAEPDFNNALMLQARWPLFFEFCLAAFVLRFALALWSGGAAKAVARERIWRKPGWLGPVALAVLVVYPIAIVGALGPQAALKWVDTYGVQILIYVLLGWGLNITVGLAGLLDLGYAAFYAVGAYAYALIAPATGLGFWALLPVCGLLAAFWGFCIGFPVLRLRGDYLAIVTLAFAEIVRIVLINWDVVTHGEAGLFGFPGLNFFGLPFIPGPRGFAAHVGLPFAGVHKPIFLYYLVLVLALAANFVSLRLRRLPLGRAWEALREDEIACRALGLDTANIKLTAFALGAFFAGVAGCLFALRQGFVSPSAFTFSESALILAIVVLGGGGSQLGVAVAAVFLVGASELLRELTFLKSVFGEDFDPAQYRMLLVGLAMVGMMNFRPRGLVSTREPTIRLGPEPAK
ncbi:branched-chain amino acid ABC transporter permease [Rhodoblastus sphagnicola]|uniref:Branched-chain amino acid ABC transporter permease n=1 Tax=Rhodoblastus sphagnicola TaxID=333368 RepID=A0A2S6MXZ6_9HYPH|nr:high-affinity branched-chain amino acid ABC transporter permease LivM [Rhodoblastus sphagnicola]MBB4198087.1 branched-chain amino acid transport system permease protein [Rhodoblastus sphagnicola]PPQ27228.1 branched-chain amino acid ABC transporter permease [Rhodoblastus sphagnicola]